MYEESTNKSRTYIPTESQSQLSCSTCILYTSYIDWVVSFLNIICPPSLVTSPCVIVTNVEQNRETIVASVRAHWDVTDAPGARCTNSNSVGAGPGLFQCKFISELLHTRADDQQQEKWQNGTTPNFTRLDSIPHVVVP